MLDNPGLVVVGSPLLLDSEFPWLAFRWAINAKPTTSTLPLTNFMSLLSMTFSFRVFCVRHYVWMECILISPVCETPSLDGERFDASSLWKIIFGCCAFILASPLCTTQSSDRLYVFWCPLGIYRHIFRWSVFHFIVFVCQKRHLRMKHVLTPPPLRKTPPSEGIRFNAPQLYNTIFEWWSEWVVSHPLCITPFPDGVYFLRPSLCKAIFG